jgi:Mlc titration factor MtfA (ptsG expression regulator)
MPVLHLGGGWYAPVRSIYVVPRYYRTDTHYVDEAGVVHEEEVEAAGEMALQGPVVLSAADVLSSGLRHGHNVVIHEMAHVLDLSNGDLDGVPALANREAAARWRRGLEEAYIEHCRRSRRRGSAPVRRRVPRPVVEPAGAENPAEFFAYAAELFFERPGALGRAHPELFDAFVSFFGVHPWNAER